MKLGLGPYIGAIGSMFPPNCFPQSRTSASPLSTRSLLRQKSARRKFPQLHKLLCCMRFLSTSHTLPYSKYDTGVANRLFIRESSSLSVLGRIELTPDIEGTEMRITMKPCLRSHQARIISNDRLRSSKRPGTFQLTATLISRKRAEACGASWLCHSGGCGVI